jgi:hypothetical protein
VVLSLTPYLRPPSGGRLGISGGVEAIIHAVSRVVMEHGQEEGRLRALMDFKNAFNLVSRRWMLAVVRERCPALLPYVHVCVMVEPPHMHVGQSVVVAKTGVHHGDPLGPVCSCYTTV